MIKIFVDSGSSIKQSEKEKYNVEIIPLKILLNNKDYYDGIDLDNDVFYKYLIEDKLFPKTSLPNLPLLEERVNELVKGGDEVIILAISSGISGTYNAFKMLFNDNPHVLVVDTKTAVGGVRILVEEINNNINETLSQLEQRINNLIPRIKVAAIPQTLNYLLRGGRLSHAEWLIGSILLIKPLIGLVDGKVKVIAKKHGIKNAMKCLVEMLDKAECDTNYPIIASYTYDRTNLDVLVSMTPDKYKNIITAYDDLDVAIACHWGPYAFGYIFVSKK